MFIVPTETPGIKLINFIPPLINLIAVFIVFSINEITPLIPVLTAPEIAFPILVPKLVNVFFMFLQIPLKKFPILLKIFLIPLYASWNLFFIPSLISATLLTMLIFKF